MSCAGCAQSIERKLLTTAGVSTATVDLATTTATITYDENITTQNSLEKVIESLGFDVLHGSMK
jgi:copper chaperone CopZ